MLILLSVLAGCRGSDVYRGDWKALDRKGNKTEITFDAKRFTVNYENGTTETLAYTQNSISIRNSTRKYGIKLKDGRFFYIYFPLSGETSKGCITLESMEPIYTIGRTDYVPFDEIIKPGSAKH
ncbi:MAG: hypothetical protein BGO56_08070 [Sphingobacteriales bacterium 48-107]|nr:MAG: hypothetical protein BGO56_08070 [Sphingobacteriales bacterium 48-107]